MDGTVVQNQHHRLGKLAGLETMELVQLFEMGDEAAAALGRAGMHDEPTRDVIERTQHRDLRLSRCGNTQIRPCLGPDAGEIGMRQRLALVTIEQNNIAGLGLPLAQAQTQTNPFDLGRDLSFLQRVPRLPAELFLRRALDNWERLMRTPARVSISARSRGSSSCAGRRQVPSRGSATRKAASLFTGFGPGATVAFTASTPPLMKSLRHSRTVPRGTPNASAIRALVQPASVSSTARARSASPRSREPARTISPARCASLAVRGDFPVMSCTSESAPTGNQPSKRWSTTGSLLSLLAFASAGLAAWLDGALPHPWDCVLAIPARMLGAYRQKEHHSALLPLPYGPTEIFRDARAKLRRGVIEATRQGLPVSGVEELLKSGRLTLAEVDRIVLPRKTLSHRRKIGRLTAGAILTGWSRGSGSCRRRGDSSDPKDKASRWLRRPGRRCWRAKPRLKCSTPPKAQGRWKTSFTGSTMASPCDDGLADLSAAVRGSLR